MFNSAKALSVFEVVCVVECLVILSPASFLRILVGNTSGSYRVQKYFLGS